MSKLLPTLRSRLPVLGGRLSSASSTFKSTTRISTLPNGLRVATEETAHKTATVGIFIDSGSRAETEKNNGVAHFLEHMIFKGTGKRTQSFLEEEVENIGAHLNAYTSREHTVYHAKCVTKDIAHSTEILADILTNSTLQSRQVERERGVILREMQEVNSIPEEVIFDLLHSAAYANTPLGRTILGPEKNIRSINADDLRSFIQTHYTANRVVLAAAGGVDHDELVKIASEYLGKIPASNSIYKPQKCNFQGNQISEQDERLTEAHVAVAVEGVGWGHPDFFPLMIAQQIIGNWDQSVSSARHLTSKLAMRCSSEQCAHRYMSFMNAYSDTGMWGVYAVTPRKKIHSFLNAMQNEWRRLCFAATDSEIHQAKTTLRGALLFALDGTTPLTEELGRQILVHGRHTAAWEIDAEIESVTPSRVRHVAKTYIQNKDPAVALYGAIEAAPSHETIRSGLHWKS